jgi:hypothetical protein
MTAQKYSNLRGHIDRFVTVWGLITAEEHSEFAGWYDRARAEAVALADDLQIDLWVACQVISAVSPAVDWNVNVRYARRTVEAWQRFRSEAERLAYFKLHKVGAPYGWANFRKAWAILDGDREIVHQGSPKTYRFARNIFEPYQTRLVTFDSHMYRLWNGSDLPQTGSIQFTAKLYRQGEADIQEYADILGITPEGLQEELWQKHLKMIATNTLPSDLGLEDW